MKRDFLTVTDDGKNICMSLDTSHEDVLEVAKKMATFRIDLRRTEYCVHHKCSS